MKDIIIIILYLIYWGLCILAVNLTIGPLIDILIFILYLLGKVFFVNGIKIIE